MFYAPPHPDPLPQLRWRRGGTGGHRRTRGVTISSNFLSGLLETDAIVLHCDERYQPCGWTAPLARTVDLKTFQNQTAKPLRVFGIFMIQTISSRHFFRQRLARRRF